MSTWARRVHRGATSLSQAVTSCGGGQAPSSRLERVKFGVPLEQLCKDSSDLPAPLLVLMLRLNKEAPRKKDVFRAPGHQGNARKLAQFLHQGRPGEPGQLFCTHHGISIEALSAKTSCRATRFLIDNFGVSNLFGRHNYEYYARLTGRVLRVEEDWIFAFRYPPDSLVPRKTSLEAERSWLQAEAQRWGLHQSAPALAELHVDEATASSSCPLERQQAQRLRTRSEWFLGGKENDGPPVVSEQGLYGTGWRSLSVEEAVELLFRLPDDPRENDIESEVADSENEVVPALAPVEESDSDDNALDQPSTSTEKRRRSSYVRKKPPKKEKTPEKS
ncbi:hypothetical protein MRX96_033757 [Rhipicephalus microplus]